jgi:hypothetical protein
VPLADIHVIDAATLRARRALALDVELRKTQTMIKSKGLTDMSQATPWWLGMDGGHCPPADNTTFNLIKVRRHVRPQGFWTAPPDGELGKASGQAFRFCFSFVVIG